MRTSLDPRGPGSRRAGAPSRRFTSQLQRAVAAAETEGRPVSVLVVELDRSNVVGSGLGRSAVDELLDQAAERIAASFGDGVATTRLHGDRFAVLLSPGPSTPDAPAFHAGAVIRDALTEPFLVADIQVSTSASIGIAHHPTDGTDPETLLDSAERASEQVKQQGGDGVLAHQPEMRATAIDRLEIEAALRDALDRGELWVAYQPRIDIATSEIRGAEALVRWDHPTLGPVPPDEFVGIAEETGLITAIGEWVLETACRQLGDWDRAGLPPITMAVNVSPRQFELGSVAEMVRRVVTATGTKPGRLELELTESVDLHDPAEVNAALTELRTFGVLCAIDDFGTGYSSLTHLTSMPVAVLKIDRAFTLEIDERGSPHTSVVLAVLDLARRLELTVVAEGVETSDQLEFLRRHGCAQAQGYLFSKPVPASQFEALLRARRRRPSPTTIDLRVPHPSLDKVRALS